MILCPLTGPALGTGTCVAGLVQAHVNENSYPFLIWSLYLNCNKG